MKKLNPSHLFPILSVLMAVAILHISAHPKKYSDVPMPDGPQGPSFANDPDALKYDLLTYSTNGGNNLGAFVPQTWDAGRVNHELQEYTPEAASQDGNTKEITITAEKVSSNRITSARLETNGVWSTSQSAAIKTRGYLEVRALVPAKTNGANLQAAWPAIWMLGHGNGGHWPGNGEIDIVEQVNGDPKIVMSLHSTHHNGGNAQHPPDDPYYVDADFTQVPGIFGLEWNVLEDLGQLDITWWKTHYDPNNGWISQHTTKSLFSWDNSDYWDFFNSFNGEGFWLIVNLAEGGDFPGQHNYDDTFIDGNPQYVVIKSALVYGAN